MVCKGVNNVEFYERNKYYLKSKSCEENGEYVVCKRSVWEYIRGVYEEYIRRVF